MTARTFIWLLRPSILKLSMLIALLFAMVAYLQESDDYHFGFLEIMDLKILDHKFISRQLREKPDEVVIAAIDEKALDAYGRWPWKRDLIAQLVDRLSQAGASVIAFDLVLADETVDETAQVLRRIERRVKKMKAGDSKSALSLKLKTLSLLREQADRHDADRRLAHSLAGPTPTVLGFFIFTDLDELQDLERDRLIDDLDRLIPSKIAVIAPLDPEHENEYLINLPQAPALLAPLPVFTDATDHYGHIEFDQDLDGVGRRAVLLYEVAEDPAVNVYPDLMDEKLIFPSLALKTAALHVKREIVVHTYDKGILAIGLGRGEDAHLIQTDRFGRMLINFYGPAKTFDTYSIKDILDNATPADAFKDRIVLVGATAKALQDMRLTPFQHDFPGVEVHANVIANILKSDYITDPDTLLHIEILLILFFGFLFGTVVRHLTALWGFLFLIIVFSVYTVIDSTLLFSNGIWVRSALPLAEAFVIFLVCYIYRYMIEERDKRRTRSAFKQYLNPSVVDTMMSDFDQLKLGGEKRTITVLFSDIRGFTSFSEKLSPDRLGDILTEYLNPMTRIVFDHRGVLDKYMGDAIMAFWGAPTREPNHAILACEAALVMLTQLEALNHDWAKQGIPRLEIGIGINTGPMWVGNMGSQVRFDYTVIGDAVNLGSRLEGTNKQYGTRIIISEFTRRAIGGSFLCRELDAIRVKGKAQPVTIYELMVKGTGSDSQRQQVKEFEAGLALYRKRRWNEAMETFVQVSNRYPDDQAARVFMARCEQFSLNPPPENWDGVFEMETK